ncbi:MAG: diaminopimelate epimerase [Krumholzibacteria bacterium]|nr:diaminopimelate epimerase [Candidatus Krumholzibacteria bacterium]
MSRTLPFTKMHGAGNDFVMLDGRDLDGPLGRGAIAALCDRRTGVGGDGLIVVGPADSAGAAFRMIYFNGDGGEAEMCGNGARCTVAFAADRGLAPGPGLGACRFDTFGGVLEGRVLAPGDVEVSLPAWRDLELDLAVPESPWSAHHRCNTGVPHLVIPVPSVDAVDLATWGPRLRHAAQFAPAGTNVNWIAPGRDGEWLLRTYERGVEAETLACGTGASAAAVILCHLDRARSPVTVRTRGGDRLVVGVDRATGALRLRGPAVTSFKGEVTIDG